MVDAIIYLVISALVSLIFIILGVRQYRAKKPVTINTGEKPPREEKLTSVTDWSHRHGRNFIILAVRFFLHYPFLHILLKKRMALCFL